jgi:hypothetical protein
MTAQLKAAGFADIRMVSDAANMMPIFVARKAWSIRRSDGISRLDEGAGEGRQPEQARLHSACKPYAASTRFKVTRFKVKTDRVTIARRWCPAAA